ncbi:hypothetical protein LCGC14_0714150 [marine sediment metagenome]|uniref:Uncharacterized protein n=1 Tax=marine sediment metagenome TaxID=412755 RepID=A0A0F9QZN0_9ZZZZ
MVESIAALLGMAGTGATATGATAAGTGAGLAAGTGLATAEGAALGGTAGVLSGLPPAAGQAALVTAPFSAAGLGQAANLGISGIGLGREGISAGQELGLLSRPGVAGQIPPPPSQELPLAVQASPLGNDPELIQLLIEAINNSRRGQA